MAQAIWNNGASNGIAVNGGAGEVLVTDFGGSTVAATFSPDWIMCIDGIYFDAVAAVAVRIYLAPVAGDTADDQQDLLNSVAVGANVQHWIGPAFNVPRVELTAGIWQPHSLFINKDAGNAKVRIHWSWRPSGNC